MNNTEKIQAAAVRILGRMEAFKAAVAAPEGTTEVIGVYDAPGSPGLVWVTASALLVANGEVLVELPYERILQARAPESKDRTKPESGQVRVVLDDGRTTVVNIVGGQGRFCDSFEFARFLARASGFARDRSATAG